MVTIKYFGLQIVAFQENAFGIRVFIFFLENEYLSMLFALKRLTSKKQTAIMEANYEKEN